MGTILFEVWSDIGCVFDGGTIKNDYDGPSLKSFNYNLLSNHESIFFLLLFPARSLGPE